jgi:hypothetical protein
VAKANANVDYALKVVAEGSKATVFFGNTSLTYTWPAADKLNDGMVGLGVDNSATKFDDFQVLVLPPGVKRTVTQNFDTGAYDPFLAISGSWTVNSGRYVSSTGTGTKVSLSNVTMDASEILDASLTVNTMGKGGLVFDYISATDYKFVLLNATTGQLAIGHVINGVTTYDAVTTFAVKTATDYAVGVTLTGGTAVLSIGGTQKLSYTFAGSLITDGKLGLLSMDSTSSFDNVLFRVK